MLLGRIVPYMILLTLYIEKILYIVLTIFKDSLWLEEGRVLRFETTDDGTRSAQQ
jgi:hypothetical protein